MFKFCLKGRSNKNAQAKQMDGIDKEINDFISWYKNVFLNDGINHHLFYDADKLLDFIERFAIWFEHRYPDKDVVNYFLAAQNINMIYEDGEYKLKEETNKPVEKASDVFTFELFFNSLKDEEKYYFANPYYSNIVYFSPLFRSAHLHLTNSGIVEMSENVEIYTGGVVSDEELEGLTAEDALSIIEQRGITLPEDNELTRTIGSAKCQRQVKEYLLNSIMYRIIQRDPTLGPLRAFIFALEFKRNIDIPMMYGYQRDNWKLSSLMVKTYIDNGGRKDLCCYTDHAVQKETITVLDLSDKDGHSKKEQGLGQNLVNVLASKEVYDAINNEEIKRKRIQRHLDRNKQKGATK